MKIIIDTEDNEIIEKVSKYLKRNKINFVKEEEKENLKINGYEFNKFNDSKSFLKEIDRFLKSKEIVIEGIEKIQLEEEFSNLFYRYSYLNDFGENSPFNGDDDKLKDLVEELRYIIEGDPDTKMEPFKAKLTICSFGGGCGNCAFDGIYCI